MPRGTNSTGLLNLRRVVDFLGLAGLEDIQALQGLSVIIGLVALEGLVAIVGIIVLVVIVVLVVETCFRRVKATADIPEPPCMPGARIHASGDSEEHF